jgi:hypothetical protein
VAPICDHGIAADFAAGESAALPVGGSAPLTSRCDAIRPAGQHSSTTKIPTQIPILLIHVFITFLFL